MNSVVVFDDMDTVMDEDLKDYILKTRDHFLTRSRRLKTKIIVLSHDFRNYRSMHVFFPRSNRFYYDSYIKDFYKFGKNERKKMLDSAKKGRWLMIKNAFPSFVMTDNLIMLIG